MLLNFWRENSGSPQTFKSYRAEIEKFLFWAWHVKAIEVREIDKILMRDYLAFIRCPYQEYIGKPTNSRFKFSPGKVARVPNENWRPFVNANHNKEVGENAYSFSSRSISLSLSVLSRFLDHLIDKDYCERNPAAALQRRKEFKHSEQNDAEEIRYFSPEQWSYILKVLPHGDSLSYEEARKRFLIIAMYSLYTRISEFSARPAHTPLMSDFKMLSQHNAYVFRIPISKGYKGRSVTVSDDLKTEFKKYRQALGLTPLPSLNDAMPLFPKVKGTSIVASGLGVKQISNIINGVINDASMLSQSEGLEEQASVLRSATPHWFRHTGISHDINFNGRSLTDVRDDAGHKSIETTSKYLHTSIKERYASTKHKTINPEIGKKKAL